MRRTNTEIADDGVRLPCVIKKVIISTLVKDVSGCPIHSVGGTLQRLGIEVWVRVPPSALSSQREGVA
jgi:hypothetical protein